MSRLARLVPWEVPVSRLTRVTLEAYRHRRASAPMTRRGIDDTIIDATAGGLDVHPPRSSGLRSAAALVSPVNAARCTDQCVSLDSSESGSSCESTNRACDARISMTVSSRPAHVAPTTLLPGSSSL